MTFPIVDDGITFLIVVQDPRFGRTKLAGNNSKSPLTVVEIAATSLMQYKESVSFDSKHRESTHGVLAQSDPKSTKIV